MMRRVALIAMLAAVPAAAQTNFPQVMPADTVYGSQFVSGPGEAIAFSVLAQRLFTNTQSGPIALANIWTNTNTFAPSTVIPAIIVNAPSNETAEASVTINKSTNGKAALEIKSALDNSGRLLSFFGPNDIANNTPAQYITTGGFLTKLFITISGTSTGTGASYDISNPTNDAFMLGIWADVPKAAQFRCNSTGNSFAGGGAILSMLNSPSTGSPLYVGADLCDGTRAFGSGSNSTFAGMDAFMGYGGPARVNMGGQDTGSPIAQTFGAYGVSAPISNNTGFLYGTVLHFAAGVPGGVAMGQTVLDISSGNENACLPGTTVSSINGGANTVTVSQYCNPYAGDTITFNGTNASTLTNQAGSTRIGLRGIPDGVVVGQTVTDSSNPTAIPGGTTISSFDTSNPPGSGGNAFIVLSAAIDGTVFNTAPGGHDTVVFSTPNTAAASFSIAGGAGTGTGAGGDMLFKVAPAGGAGSTQNSLSTALTISGTTKAATFAGTLGVPQATWADNQTCTAGQISVDANFIYVCTSANTVKRAAISAF